MGYSYFRKWDKGYWTPLPGPYYRFLLIDSPSNSGPMGAELKGAVIWSTIGAQNIRKERDKSIYIPVPSITKTAKLRPMGAELKGAVIWSKNEV